MFHSQKIPEYSCAMKETIDIDILVTSTNKDLNCYMPMTVKSSKGAEKMETTVPHAFINESIF